LRLALSGQAEAHDQGDFTFSVNHLDENIAMTNRNNERESDLSIQDFT
jgi:hypothetical protein